MRDDKESVSCLHFWCNIWLVRLSLRLGKPPFTRTIRDIYESINTIWDVPKNQNQSTPRNNNTMEILHHIIIDKLIVSCVFVLFSVGIHPETQIFPSPAQELCFQTIVLFRGSMKTKSLCNGNSNLLTVWPLQTPVMVWSGKEPKISVLVGRGGERGSVIIHY